jgi:hypothetical protein
VRALRELAEFCEGYQVCRLREAGHSWARIAAWAGVSPQAVHKKYAQAPSVTAPSQRQREGPCEQAQFDRGQLHLASLLRWRSIASPLASLNRVFAVLAHF